jgi:hypothetical protein
MRVTPEPPASVKLKARSHASFYIGTRMNVANAEGIVAVAPKHLDQLFRSGCEQIDARNERAQMAHL